jgi:hypothetical protein
VQVVLDDSLGDAARAKDLWVSRLCDEVERIVDRCTRNKTRIVGFTSHEHTVIGRYVDEDLGPMYADAHKVAKEWKRRCRGGDYLFDRSLRSFLRMIGSLKRADLGEKLAAVVLPRRSHSTQSG